MFRKAWKEADAMVIVAHHFVSTAEGEAGVDSRSDLVVEVHPVGDAPFRADTKITIWAST